MSLKSRLEKLERVEAARSYKLELILIDNAECLTDEQLDSTTEIYIYIEV